MLKTRHVLCLLVLFIGCKQASEDTNTSTALKEKTTAAPTGETPDSKKTAQKRLLHVVQRTHHFSSAEHPDYFRLMLRGDSVVAGQVYFTITTRDGKIIHNETFPAADLEAVMVYQMKKPTATSRERETFILQRMEEFVQPDDFISPAIPANAQPDTAFVTLSSWNQIQDRKNAIGFKYLLGKEDGRILVFDPEKQKAVRYSSFGG